jgi:hypothetical protein
MKKSFAFLLLLALVLFAMAAVAEDTGTQVKIGMAFTPTRAAAGDEIHVTIQITNVAGYEIPAQLYDPSGALIPEFGVPAFLADGETKHWTGTWIVTEEQAEKASIVYTVRYKFKDESGNWVQKATRFHKKIIVPRQTPVITETPSPSPTPEPTPDPATLADVILYSVLRPNPGDGTVHISCIDADGIFWTTHKADIEYPFMKEDILELLRERRGMTEGEHMIGTTEYIGKVMDKEFFRSLSVMASVAPRQEGYPRKTGIDVLELSVYALRDDPEGNPDPVLLGISGSAVFENTDPNAQALYRFMWTRLLAHESYFSLVPYGYAAEGVAPHGFETVSAREFFHLEGVDAQAAVVTAGMNDCEEGFLPYEPTEEEQASARKVLERGMVTGMDNPWIDSGGFVSYVFKDAEGKVLGSMEIEDGLAVGKDGMYRISVLPEPVENLTADEIRLLTLKLEGVEYIIGKSTPRDLIRNGWRCSLEDDGTFLFEDAERYSYIIAKTAGGCLDEPILDIDCQFAGWTSHEYYGYTSTAGNPVNGMDEYFMEDMGAEIKEASHGPALTKTLSDGRSLYVYSGDTVIVELRDAEQAGK